VEPTTETTALDADRLALGLAPPLEKNVEFLNDCLDDVQVSVHLLRHIKLLTPFPL